MARASAPPTYAERERHARVVRATKVGYFKAKSRRRRYMSRRAPVSDSKRAYRCGVMKTTPLSTFRAFSKAPSYSGPCTSRVGKTVAESILEGEALPYMEDLIDLTKNSDVDAVHAARREARVRDEDVAGHREVIVLYDTSDDDEKQKGSALAKEINVNTAQQTHENRQKSSETFGAASISPHDVIDLLESSDDERSGEKEGLQMKAGIYARIGEDPDISRVYLPASPDIIHVDDSSDENASEVGESAVPELGRKYTELDAVPWPADVTEIPHTENPNKIVVPDLGPMDWCGCEIVCRPDRCPNALSSIFCASNNCLNGSSCGNRLKTASGLHLASGDIGYSVFTTETVYSGSIVTEYAGVLTTHDYRKDKKRISDYTIGLDLRSSRKEHLWIEARSRGNITRFMNHSCAANCRFYEVQNRRFVTVVVVAMEDIMAASEVTVDYGDEIWFKCQCGSNECRGVSIVCSDVSD